MFSRFISYSISSFHFSSDSFNISSRCFIIYIVSEGSNYRCRKIHLSNNNRDLLRYVQYLLERYFSIIATGPYLSIKAGRIGRKRNGEKIKTNHNNYYIAISRKKHVKIFLSEIGFSIRDKQLGLPRRR